MTTNFVTIKFNERTHKLRLASINIRNLSMIYKLNPARGNFLSSEAEGQIILADDDGNFSVEDFSKCYVVNGEVQAPVPETSNMSNPRAVQPIGLPLSYQRSSTNPPPCTRPTFSASLPKNNGQNKWKKSFMVIDVSIHGEVTEKFQVHLTLQEETATVEQVSTMLADQLGYDVTLLDAKHLPIMAGNTTQGLYCESLSSYFILECKKIYAFILDENELLRSNYYSLFFIL